MVLCRRCWSEERETYRCESACGAHSCCDDVAPYSYVYSSACQGFCDFNCKFIAWSVSIASTATKVKVGNSVTITATSSVPVDSSQDYYLEILEDNAIVRTCGSGTTCSYTVSKSAKESHNYRARVVRISKWRVSEIASSSTITVSWVQCLSDNDCPQGYRCDTQQGTCYAACSNDNDCPGGYRCDTSSGKCYTSCNADDQCKTASGYYCYCGVCSQGWNNGKCGAEKCCNRGYGGSGIGSCVNLGTIYNSGSISYICGFSSSDGGGGGGGGIRNPYSLT